MKSLPYRAPAPIGQMNVTMPEFGNEGFTRRCVVVPRLGE